MDLVILALTFFGIPAVLYFLYDRYIKAEDRRRERRHQNTVYKNFWNPSWMEDGCFNQILAGLFRWVLAIVVWGGIITAILYFLFGISVFGLPGF